MTDLEKSKARDLARRVARAAIAGYEPPTDTEQLLAAYVLQLLADRELLAVELARATSGRLAAGGAR